MVMEIVGIFLFVHFKLHYLFPFFFFITALYSQTHAHPPVTIPMITNINHSPDNRVPRWRRAILCATARLRAALAWQSL